ncbi:hypothetical protein ACFTWF_24425 [Rhodococcus sp. NPDC056960]|uniref:hypothetical protein n=1 Tax=Rhodococcus sp. NPDC056960 TaxID=3345982 RepID=UPI00362E09BF
MSAQVQPHCHQHAVLHYGADRTVRADAGVDATVLDTGCCGLAGNFGFERGHYDISVACAEDTLLPAIRDADPTALILADGFSCRTQIRDLQEGTAPLHTAQVLAAAVRGRQPGRDYSATSVERASVPAAIALAAAPVTLAVAGLVRRTIRRRRTSGR